MPLLQSALAPLLSAVQHATCEISAGRRCEAKLALPRGGANPNRTTRIFVARILPTVTDEAFRAHFEQYGTVQVRTSPCAYKFCWPDQLHCCSHTDTSKTTADWRYQHES